MLGGADNPNGELPSYITGANMCGVFPNQDGTFTAMTYTKSKTFKTETGARRWLKKNSGE
ncbi:YdaF family protein [Escherichia coli]|uniref:YdaF family protein n=1 Tax=Escherichia coli TaxID=562 RepID=UPI0021C65DF1|nr:YdaF family protein [Escherichia coli]